MSDSDHDVINCKLDTLIGDVKTIAGKVTDIDRRIYHDNGHPSIQTSIRLHGEHISELQVCKIRAISQIRWIIGIFLVSVFSMLCTFAWIVMKHLIVAKEL
ncbi:MAG: hypothetical protein ACOYOU_15110 [Kiritimatiellia bacterium]